MLKHSVLLLILSLLLSCSAGTPGPRAENPVILGVNYVGIAVSDIDRSSKLLETAFGFSKIQDTSSRTEAAVQSVSPEASSFSSRLLRSSNAQIRLMQFDRPSAAAQDSAMVAVNGPGIAHVCAQFDKELGAYEKFLAGGAKHVGAKNMVQLSSRNPVYYAYARDHDQTMFEVEHVDIAALNLASPPKHRSRIRHVALASPDIERALDFYSVLLEQEKPRRLGRWLPMSGESFDAVSGLAGTRLKMAFFQVRNMELEIAQYLSHPTETPAQPRPIDALGHNMIVFDVSSIEAARAKLLDAGGSIAAEATMDGEPILFGRDPDGTLLGFQQLDAKHPLSAQNFAGNGT